MIERLPSGRLDARRTWLACALPPAAWFLFQQGWGTTVRLACAAGGSPLGPLVGAGALAVCALAAWLAWAGAWTPAREPHDRARRFAAQIAVGVAALFGLAILFQALATIIVPSCAR